MIENCSYFPNSKFQKIISCKKNFFFEIKKYVYNKRNTFYFIALVPKFFTLHSCVSKLRKIFSWFNQNFIVICNRVAQIIFFRFSPLHYLSLDEKWIVKFFLISKKIFNCGSRLFNLCEVISILKINKLFYILGNFP